jgi:hypothetical protein
MMAVLPGVPRKAVMELLLTGRRIDGILKVILRGSPGTIA